MILRAEHPDVYTRERVADSVADVAHRSLFGLQLCVNDRPPTGPPVPRPAIGEHLGTVLERADEPSWRRRGATAGRLQTARGRP